MTYYEDTSAINFDNLSKQFRDEERPLYILEEKKLNDVIEGLLEVTNDTVEKHKEDMKKTFEKSINCSGELTRPVLALMMWGPQSKISHQTDNVNCKLENDSWNRNFLDETFHNCSEYEVFHHWRFSHHPQYSCLTQESSKLLGPVMTRELTLVYPCNIGMCSIHCQCNLCKNTRHMICSLVNHKKHMEHFDIDCLVQKNSQCQEHWVTHPDNFNREEDIFVEKNLFFHNGELVDQPRNHTLEKIKFAGIKKKCIPCRENIYDHFKNHLDIHPCCKFCSFQLATLKDSRYWEKVCNTCGKVFDRKKSLNWHKKIHIDSNSYECNLCHAVLRRKFTLLRHRKEKHGEEEEVESIQTEFLNNFDRKKQCYSCDKCDGTFELKRNFKLHIKTCHQEIKLHNCKLCVKSFKFKISLKRHLMVDHKQSEDNFLCTWQKHTCAECKKEFTRSDTLKAHIKYFHTTQKLTLPCDQCDRTFLKKSNLTRHIKLKHM